MSNDHRHHLSDAVQFISRLKSRKPFITFSVSVTNLPAVARFGKRQKRMTDMNKSTIRRHQTEFLPPGYDLP